ncbi:type II toxin-antitoxin system HicB family antitoxin [Methanophagales archaeon]|nr:MAG: type II toxin-antitoxin system HicB family antitoxin [Methanophagales archaeon]RJS76582.1 MAG: type II toxin-antitoxin system HicB family antitoxin [Methanophagales archaeon]
MLKHFTLEYWIDDNWYIGRLKEVPGVFSQGKSLEELEENIRDVYSLMVKDEISHWAMAQTQTKEIGTDSCKR